MKFTKYIFLQKLYFLDTAFHNDNERRRQGWEFGVQINSTVTLLVEQHCDCSRISPLSAINAHLETLY